MAGRPAELSTPNTTRRPQGLSALAATPSRPSGIATEATRQRGNRLPLTIARLHLGGHPSSEKVMRIRVSQAEQHRILIAVVPMRPPGHSRGRHGPAPVFGMSPEPPKLAE